MIYGNTVGCSGLAQTYILEDSEGNEATAVLVDSEVVFDATPNDIRAGKIAVTESGVTVGTKDIPAYHTTEGKVKILSGETAKIQMFSDKCKYTKFQAIICSYNTSVNDSVSAEKVAIEENVYEVNSVDAISIVGVNEEAQSIDLGFINNSENPILIRFFTYKEE